MSAGFLSYAVVAAGLIVSSTPWAMHPMVAPGGVRLDTAADAATYVAGFAAEPGQQVLVWLGGGVDAVPGAPADGLPPAHATAGR
jgi:hypothetical protein